MAAKKVKKYFINNAYNDEYEDGMTLKQAEGYLNDALNRGAGEGDILVFDENDAIKFTNKSAVLIIK